MLIAAWILVGLVAGTIARSVLITTHERFLTDAVLGIVGALGTGWIFNGFETTMATGLNLFSVLAAFIGAGLLIVTFRHARRHARYRGRGGAWGTRT